VAPGQQRDQQALQKPVLADDQAFDLEQDLLDRRGHPGGQLPCRFGGARRFRAGHLRTIDHWRSSLSDGPIIKRSPNEARLWVG